jgi:hypothetical protein
MGAAAGLLASAAAAIIAIALRRRTWLKWTGALFGAAIAIYFVLLLGFSLASREIILAVGEEKRFCEIDCHLAYSVQSVTSPLPPTAPAGAIRYVVTLRTRFDETTIASGGLATWPSPPHLATCSSLPTASGTVPRAWKEIRFRANFARGKAT